MGIEADGVWKLTMSSPQGREEWVLRLASEGRRLSGEISGPSLGTHAISEGGIDGSSLHWVVTLSNPVDIQLEMSVDLEHDRLSGESRAGEYGVTSIIGERGIEVDWETRPGPHCHRSPVRLPDATTVVAVSYDAADPYRREIAPDFGLYLDRRWAPPWDHDHLDWPDFGLPAAPSKVAAKLDDLVERARRGQRVEIGCLGAWVRIGNEA